MAVRRNLCRWRALCICYAVATVPAVPSDQRVAIWSSSAAVGRSAQNEKQDQVAQRCASKLTSASQGDRVDGCYCLAGSSASAERHFETLVSRLEDHALSVRIAAAEAVKWLWLGGAVDAEAIATVYALATSSSFSDTRAAGCGGLGALGAFAEPHIAVIARRLEDDSADVRTSAEEALGRLLREGAVDAKMLSGAYASVAGSSNPAARASGCSGLGSVGNAVKPYALLLAWKLSDESVGVRTAAKAAVDRLRQDEVDADVLARIYAAAASGVLAEARAVGCLGLGALGNSAMPHVQLLNHIMLTDQSPDVQRAATLAAEALADTFLVDKRMLLVHRLAAARRQDLPSNAEYLLVSCPEFDETGEPVLQFAVEVMKAYGGTSATGGVYRAIQLLQAKDPSKALILLTIDGESEYKFDTAQFEREMPNLATNTRTYHVSNAQDLVSYFESGGLIPDI